MRKIKTVTVHGGHNPSFTGTMAVSSRRIATKTMAQTAIATIGTAAVMGNVNW